MDKSVMVVKGQKQVSGRSSNTKGSDNIISNGSGIAVADAMKAAAENPGGAMTGFMGVGMAAGAGGMNAQNLFAMG